MAVFWQADSQQAGAGVWQQQDHRHFTSQTEMDDSDPAPAAAMPGSVEADATRLPLSTAMTEAAVRALIHEEVSSAIAAALSLATAGPSIEGELVR